MVILGLEGYAQYPEIVRAPRGRAGSRRPSCGAARRAFSIRRRRRTGAIPRSCGRSCPTGSRRPPQLGSREGRPRQEDARPLGAPCAQPRRRGDRLVHAQRARHGAHVRQHEGRRLAGRRLHPRADRRRPSLRGRRPVPRPRRRPLPVRLELRIQVATSRGCPATTAPRSCTPISASPHRGHPSRLRPPSPGCADRP